MLAYMCACAPHACGALRDQKRESDTQELELHRLETTMWVLGITPGPLQVYQGLLTSAPSLVPIFPVFEKPPR